MYIRRRDGFCTKISNRHLFDHDKKKNGSKGVKKSVVKKVRAIAKYRE